MQIQPHTQSFLTLFTNEVRLRLRQERMLWIVLAYTVLAGVLSWFALSTNSDFNQPGTNGFSHVGLNLFELITQVQLLLIILITPLFTATSINGEKERQTFDMLICSQLSAVALVTSKLLASLTSALILTIASIPLFSLIFFFGGVSLGQIMISLLIFTISTMLISSLCMFFSTILERSISSIIASYVSILLWLLLPALIFLVFTASGASRIVSLHPQNTHLLYLWNPVTALGSIYSYSGGNWFLYAIGLGSYSDNGTIIPSGAPYTFLNLTIPPALLYIIISSLITVIFFVLSILTVKPLSVTRKIRVGKATSSEQTIEEHRL